MLARSLRAGVRRSIGAGQDLPHHAASASGCRIMARFSRQAGDAQWVEPQLKLARGTVVADRLEEQVQDAEAFGDELQVPDRIEERDGAWRWAADGVSRWTAVSSSRSSAMRCLSWWSSSARRFVVMSLRASLPPMACSTRLPSWRHRCCSATSCASSFSSAGARSACLAGVTRPGQYASSLASCDNRRQHRDG
jgi:hypothetical protein